MDTTSTSVAEMTPEQTIREYLQKNPIKLSPWEIKRYFSNEANVSEEYLECSLEKLKEVSPEFEENHEELIKELEKNVLLVVPMIKKIPITTLLQVISESVSNIQIFPFLPDFPKPPATKLLDHIFPDNSLSSEEKITEYEQIAKNTTRILEYLISWRDHVAKYVDGLESFLEEYDAELTEEQKERIGQMIMKSKKTIPQINNKIEQKKRDSAEELREFEQFYRVVSQEPKYSSMNPSVARSQIQIVFDESDHSLRRIVARMGEEIEENGEGVEEKFIKEEEIDEEEEKTEMTRKRSADEKKKTANGKSNGSRASTSPAIETYPATKKSRVETCSQRHQKGGKVSVSVAEI
ncbi:hypothetical protein GCK72_001601 [Caenorhabditis remanei]|uniref:Uncharacterized protein n=1 Tax=Caenorhabditis remanei TaxID=31234 RepID=A0A6A5HT39_CAERE|nr:hypothetical protein GCK72_001601 [Caenorhabditis remanei]KAF1769784.1 hypothetical protein GCK72_001601 [Caenorhabditis remanei]